MELSGWQTVLIALGGGIITGTAALLVAFLSGKSAGRQLKSRLEHERQQQAERLDRERDERWTERQVGAADDFATGVEQAIIGVRALIAVVQEQRDVDPAVVEAHRRVHEAIARLARIRLLFRQHTNVTRPAETLLEELELARIAAADPDPSFARSKLEEVDGLRDEFLAEAIAVMRGSPDGLSASA